MILFGLLRSAIYWSLSFIYWEHTARYRGVCEPCSPIPPALQSGAILLQHTVAEFGARPRSPFQPCIVRVFQAQRQNITASAAPFGNSASVLLGACPTMLPLPDEKRWEIIQCFKSQKSVGLVSRALKIDRKVVKRWINRYNSTGGVAARKLSGRKPSLTTSQAALALERLTSCSTSTASRGRH